MFILSIQIISNIDFSSNLDITSSVVLLSKLDEEVINYIKEVIKTVNEKYRMRSFSLFFRNAVVNSFLENCACININGQNLLGQDLYGNLVSPDSFLNFDINLITTEFIETELKKRNFDLDI